MEKSRVRIIKVFTGFVLLLSITAAVIKLRSYCHISTRIGGYNVISKEITINKENGEVKRIDLNTTDVYTTLENNLWIIGDGISELVIGEEVKSLDADNLSLVFKGGKWYTR